MADDLGDPRALQQDKATAAIVNADPSIENMWVWGNNDVLPKRAPVTQTWLEEFGAFLLDLG